jgi:hypothetical protein
MMEFKIGDTVKRVRNTFSGAIKEGSTHKITNILMKGGEKQHLGFEIDGHEECNHYAENFDLVKSIEPLKVELNYEIY